MKVGKSSAAPGSAVVLTRTSGRNFASSMMVMSAPVSIRRFASLTRAIFLSPRRLPTTRKSSDASMSVVAMPPAASTIFTSIVSSRPAGQQSKPPANANRLPCEMRVVGFARFFGGAGVFFAAMPDHSAGQAPSGRAMRSARWPRS